jgi:hypothetical protein
MHRASLAEKKRRDRAAGGKAIPVLLLLLLLLFAFSLCVAGCFQATNPGRSM